MCQIPDTSKDIEYFVEPNYEISSPNWRLNNDECFMPIVWNILRKALEFYRSTRNATVECASARSVDRFCNSSRKRYRNTSRVALSHTQPTFSIQLVVLMVRAGLGWYLRELSVFRWLISYSDGECIKLMCYFMWWKFEEDNKRMESIFMLHKTIEKGIIIVLFSLLLLWIILVPLVCWV